jgi:hypothetical protein
MTKQTALFGFVMGLATVLTAPLSEASQRKTIECKGRSRFNTSGTVLLKQSEDGQTLRVSGEYTVTDPKVVITPVNCTAYKRRPTNAPAFKDFQFFDRSGSSSCPFEYVQGSQLMMMFGYGTLAIVKDPAGRELGKTYMGDAIFDCEYAKLEEVSAPSLPTTSAEPLLFQDRLTPFSRN